MAKNIDPQLRKIGDYLKLDEDTVFMIPEYQRAYSWRTEHCDKLWQDIEDFVASDSKDRYFFGTIIINCQDNDTRFDLIDGQQRTTTFLLLLKAMLIRINVAIGQTANDEESASLCSGLKDRRRKIMGILYRAEPEDISDKPDRIKDAAICSRQAILVNRSINELYKNELNVILQAVDYIGAEAEVKKIPYKQKDNKYTNFFRNFKFFYEKISEQSVSELNRFAKAVIDNCEVIEIKSWQVEQAITMFNSLNSDGLPLYDSDIISARLYAEAEKNGEGVQFTKLWKELKDHITDLEAAGLGDIDAILMQHMYYVRARNKEIISESGSINVTTPGLRRYYIEINKDVVKEPVALCEQLINLSKIWKKVASYPIAQVLFKFNVNSKLFLASYFYRFSAEEINEQRIMTILECLLRLFTIMELVDVGYSSSNFKTFLFGEEVKLVDPNISEETIKADFDKHISEKWKDEDIMAQIVDYDKNAMVYLNEYLFARQNGLFLNLGNKNDIEHIMPNSGNNLQEIRKDAELVDMDEFREYVNKLGNKILLEEKINRAIGNEWFRTKVSTHLIEKTGYIDSDFPLAKELVKRYHGENKPYWKKDDIAKATEEAGNRIVSFIFGQN